MKRLIYLLLLFPVFAQAQINGTIQKTAATGVIRGSFGSIGIDTVARVQAITSFTNGQTLKWNTTLNKFQAISPVNLVDSTVFRTVANSRSLAQTQTALNGKVTVSPGTAQTGFINMSGNITSGATVYGSNAVFTNTIENNAAAYASGGYSLLVKNTTSNVFQTVPSTTFEVPLTFSTGLSRSTNTVTNTGVLSITGTANQVTASASTGDVTLSLPQSIATTSGPTFASLSVRNTGSNTVGAGPFYETFSVSANRGWLSQLNASNGMDEWYYNGSLWAIKSSIDINGKQTLASLQTTGQLRAIESGGFSAGTEQIGASIVDATGTISGVRSVARFSNNGTNYITKIILSDNATSDAFITYQPSLTATSNKLGWAVNSNTNQLELNGNGNLALITTPTTSAGTYDALTRNASTGAVEKVALASGTYTPTLTNVANISSSTVGSFSYLRVGDQVTVYGVVTITITSAEVTTELGITLPVASNFTSSQNARGHGVNSGTGQQGVYIISDSTNDRVTFRLSPSFGGVQEFYFSFQYTVL